MLPYICTYYLLTMSLHLQCLIWSDSSMSKHCKVVVLVLGSGFCWSEMITMTNIVCMVDIIWAKEINLISIEVKVLSAFVQWIKYIYGSHVYSGEIANQAVWRCHCRYRRSAHGHNQNEVELWLCIKD